MNKKIVYYDGITTVRRMAPRGRDLRFEVLVAPWADSRSVEAAFNAVVRAVQNPPDAGTLTNGGPVTRTAPLEPDAR